MVNTKNALTVYKASAGSGKTFTLTLEYIKLLVLDPNCYRNILAVTFTNKATEEMKMRILSTLYGLSRKLPGVQQYMDLLTESTGFTPIMVAHQADESLKLLLHNYNYFKVQTIDKFFQSVLHNMTCELDLTANLRLELNSNQVEAQAVDELIENLHTQDKVFGWIMLFIKEKIAQDQNWNVIGLLKNFGKQLFKDSYRENSEQINHVLNTEGVFEAYTNQLNDIRAKAQNCILHYATSFFDILEENGYTIDDFNKKKSGVCGYFTKLKDEKYTDKDLLNMTVLDAMENPEKWVKANERTPGNEKLELVRNTLLPFLLETEKMRQKQARLYFSADLTLHDLHQLRLLESIEKTMREINAETNRFLLSDTQHLLNGIVQDSDSSFIFEKIGTRLKHIMIDEFQDTSTIQWKNFKVLLMDCMSNESTHNLIVGDVKQSIYRWRSGDWRLLNNIENEFKGHEEQIVVKPLTTNYRSEHNIVCFNNAFFTLAAEEELAKLGDNTEALQLEQAYKDVAQLPKNQEAYGRVEITLMPSDEYKESVMENIFSTYEHLILRGANPSSIAILCRNNKTTEEIASYFNINHSDVPLISDEAFRLDASTAVNAIISALRFISNPSDDIEGAFLEQAGILRNIDQKRDEMLTMPLYDLVIEIYGLLKGDKFQNQSAYILTFFDKISQYTSENLPDINDLLEEWDTNMHENTIQSSNANGVRLLTIHKSKGLEFDYIIMPACDWKLEQASTLWCTPSDKPFNELPLVPITFSEQRMSSSIYAEDYHHEHLQNVVDNLNLLYVAFTRAKKGLFIFGKRGTAAIRSGLIETIWQKLATQLCATTDGDITNKKDTLTFEFGELSVPQGKDAFKEAEHNQNAFNQTPLLIDMSQLQVSESSAVFRQSNQSIEFISENEDTNDSHMYIKMGSVLHKIFSLIRTSDDIDTALQQLENDGILYDSEIKRDKLINMLRQRLENEKVSEWFSDKWTVLNECSIIFFDPEQQKTRQLRPDRVMTDGNEYIVIDFKFGKPKDDYYKQVKDYMTLLQDMGHQHVSGYLWFVYTNKIEEVK